MLSDREPWPEYPGGIIHRHYIASKYEGSVVHQRIQDMIKEVVYTLKLTDGPVYFQIIIRDEQPYLIEVTPRLDGCHLWRLIREACGVNLLEMTMNHLLYGNPLARQRKNLDEAVVPDCHDLQLEFFCRPPGEQFDSTCFQAKESLFQQMYYQDGTIVRPVNGYMEKCGYRICRIQR